MASIVGLVLLSGVAVAFAVPAHTSIGGTAPRSVLHELGAEALRSPSATTGSVPLEGNVHPLVAEVSSSWSTFRHDAERDGGDLEENTLASSNISSLRALWDFDAGYAVEGSPTIVGDRVYVGAWNGYEYALNASNGTLAWKTYLGVTTGTCTYAPEVGVTSSAAVVNDTLFVGGGDDYWYALNASSGAIVGKVYVGQNGASGGNYNWASPLIVGDDAYIGIASECDSPLVRGGLLMVNISDPSNISNASVVHAFYTVPSGYTGNSVWASPSYDPATNSVYIATGNWGSYTGTYAQAVIALNATDLAVRSSWQVLSTPNGDSDFSGGPMVFLSNRTPLVVAINKDGLDYAFNATSLSSGPVWTRAVSNPRWGYGPPASNATALFLTAGDVSTNGTTRLGSVVAVTPENGSLWTHYSPGFVQGGASYADGIVFDAASNITFGGSGYAITTTLEMLNSSTGALLDSVVLPDTAVNSTLSIADGRLYVGYANQTLSDGGGVIAYGLPLAVNGSVAPTATSGEYSFAAGVSGGSPGYTFNWSFGDGNSSTVAAPVHGFAAPGNYSIRLVVTDTFGQVANWTATLYVPPAPVPLDAGLSVSPTRGVAPLLTYDNATAVGGVRPYAVSWDFGDGARATGELNVSHAYTSTGAYTVTVNVTDALGATRAVSVPVTVFPPLSLTASATPSTGSAPLTVSFSADAKGGTSPPAYAWSFGDGSPNGTGPNTTHRYLASGPYNATVLVTDDADDQVRYTLTILVLPPAPFTVTVATDALSNCSAPSEGGNAVLTATVSGGVAPYTYSWSFGDGTSSTLGAQVTHRYAATRAYVVGVVVTDSNGAQATATASLTWLSPPCGTLHASTPTTGPTTLYWTIAAGAAAAGLAALAVVAYRFSRRPRNPNGPPGGLVRSRP